MYCMKCGEKNNDACSFCEKCGSPLRVTRDGGQTKQAVPDISQVSESLSVYGQPIAPKRKKKTLLISILEVVLVVALAATGTFVYMNFSKGANVSLSTETPSKSDNATSVKTTPTIPPNVLPTPTLSPIPSNFQQSQTSGNTIGNIPNGSIDYQYIPTVTISIPTTTTIIKPSDMIAQDSGVVSFYTTSDFSDANKVSDNGITIIGNSIILYTKIVSSDNTVTKYYKVVFNVVKTAKKYVISNTNFAPVGSNFLATVTIDRGQASTLANPKLLLIYTLADGETQVFLSQNALVGANEVVVGAGVSRVTAVLVDGNVDWSAGSPIYKSAFVKISVPVQ